MIILNWSQDKC